MSRIQKKHKHNSTIQLSKATDKASTKKSSKAKASMPYATLSQYTQNKSIKMNRPLLKQLSFTNNIARVCIEVIKKTVLQTEWDIVAKNEADSKKVKEQVLYLTNLLRTPNTNSPIDTWRKIVSNVVDDILSVDNGIIEKVRSPKGQIVSLYAVDGLTIFPNIDEHGLYRDPAYCQYLKPTNSEGIFDKPAIKPDAEFNKEGLLVFQMNPENGSRTGYGRSIISMVSESIVNFISATNFNASYFGASKIPPAIANLKGAKRDDLVAFKEAFNAELRNNDHAIAFTGAEKLDFQMLRPTNMDMQYTEWYEKLTEVIVSGFGLTVQDVGLLKNVNKSTSEVESDLSTRRGVNSMLSVIAEEINRDLIGDLAEFDPNYHLVELQFQSNDLKDEKKDAEVNKIYLDSGVLLKNEVRRELGYDPIEEEEEGETSEKVQVEAQVEEKEEVEKSVRLEKQVDLGIEDEKPSYPDQDKVDFELIGNTLVDSIQAIVTTIGTTVEQARQLVKDQIKKARDNESPLEASQVMALTEAQTTPILLAEAGKVSVFATQQATDMTSVNTAFDSTLLDEGIQVGTTTTSKQMVDKLNGNVTQLSNKATTVKMNDESIDKGVDDTFDKFLNTTLQIGAVATVLNTYNSSSLAFYNQSNDVVGVRFTAVLDSQTTERCSSLDGSVFLLTDSALSNVIPPLHPNCRSIMTPVTRGENVIFETRTPIPNPTLLDFKDGDAFTKAKSEITIDRIGYLIDQL
jgi:SPP1 gp7 family putative phage head morphogenesis protein